MENQSAQREKSCPNSGDGRISELPQPLLHNILAFLSQKDATKTCILSKSWRSIGPTRPKIEFNEMCYEGNHKKFLSNLDSTLQIYHGREICLQEFILCVRKINSNCVSLLKKWVPIVLLDMGVKRLHLISISRYFALPSIVFEAETLEELHLKRCRIDSVEKVLSWHVRKVSFFEVHITEEHLRKIISSCPLIEYLALDACRGLKTVEVHNDNLKHFEYSHSLDGLEETIKIDAPNIESIRIEGRASWPHNGRASWLHNGKTFTCLKSVLVKNVVLTQKDFDSFSVDFCCLEDLKIHFCIGFEEFQLSSRSIKRLYLAVNGPTKAAIDLPNILSFELFCGDFPSIKLTTNSSEWRSLILLKRHLITRSETSYFYVKLNELLRAMNHSRIDLHMRDFPLKVPHGCGGFGETAVIESLAFSHRHPCSSLEAFLNYFFGSFRPKYIEQSFYPRSKTEEFEDSIDDWRAYKKEADHFTDDIPTVPESYQDGVANELIDRLWIFLMKKEREDRIWQQDLEEVSVEAYGRNGVEWRCVQSENLSQLALPNNDDQKIRFQLKWRE